MERPHRKALERQIRGRVLYGELLNKHASFGIGGPADIMVFPEGVEDVQAAMVFCRHAGVPYLVLGGGSNLLVRDGGFRGMVFHLDAGFQQLGESLRQARQAYQTVKEYDEVLFGEDFSAD